jgi:hypothetical protein
VRRSFKEEENTNRSGFLKRQTRKPCSEGCSTLLRETEARHKSKHLLEEANPKTMFQNLVPLSCMTQSENSQGIQEEHAVFLYDQ